MKRTFELRPRIAAYLEVEEPGVSGPQAVLFMSKERGVVVGLHDRPLAAMGWPLELQAAINKHFGTVFSLRHEDWREPGPTPRARYLEQMQPWTLEVDVGDGIVPKPPEN